jgi:hypothetical protein
MSEYTHSTGIFKLTLEDARNFHRTKDRRISPPEMEYYAEKLGRLGFTVTSIEDDSLQVKAAPDEVWEALSGEHPFL